MSSENKPKPRKPRKQNAAQAWRKRTAAVTEVTLGSGLTVKYRHVALLALVKAGVVPKNLLPAAIKAAIAPLAMTGEQWVHAYTVQQRLVVAALIEPVAVLKQDEVTDEATQICVDDIPQDDLEELAAILMDQQKEDADPTRASSTGPTLH